MKAIFDCVNDVVTMKIVDEDNHPVIEYINPTMEQKKHVWDTIKKYGGFERIYQFSRDGYILYLKKNVLSEE